MSKTFSVDDDFVQHIKLCRCSQIVPFSVEIKTSDVFQYSDIGASVHTHNVYHISNYWASHFFRFYETSSAIKQMMYYFFVASSPNIIYDILNID